MSNSSSISHFLLLPLADTRQLQLLHFCLFLGISLAALLGNGLIISAVACGQRLHSPMFFFLLNLALTDLGSICTTVPKAMHNSLWDTSHISYSGCAAQVFFFMFFITAEYCLLTIMCYDRYVSICKPLHYGTLLGSRACAHMAAAAWASAFLYALMHTANTFSLPLCHGNALGQFFCEIPHILKLSCSHSSLRKLGVSVFTTSLAFGCFVFMVFSYVQIFRAVLRIPSEQGRHKAFSTCLPHLAVLSLFLSTGTFAYLKPPSISSPSLDLALSLLYSVVPPALNPLIYSLRNQELKAAVWTLMAGAMASVGAADILSNLEVAAQFSFCRGFFSLQLFRPGWTSAPSREGGPVETRLVTLPKANNRVLSAELAVTELEAAGGAPGLPLLCRSPQALDSSLLSVCIQPRSGRDSKWCQLRWDEDGHLWLSGVARRFCSLRELLGTSRCWALQAEGPKCTWRPPVPPSQRGHQTEAEQMFMGLEPSGAVGDLQLARCFHLSCLMAMSKDISSPEQQDLGPSHCSQILPPVPL
ncbi:olfactory receptor 14J1-like [Cyanocitta cristata]